MPKESKKVRIATLSRMKHEGRKITAATAYDAVTGAWADSAGVDFILVGDSLGNTALGLADTIGVRLEHMIHHAAAVARGARRALRVGDMPFMTYKVTPEQAIANCTRMIQEGMAEAVKVEGGLELAPTVGRLVRAGIPVMGHIGVLPQSFHQQSGYHLQGRDEAAALQLRESAKGLQDAGAFAVVFECVSAPLAGEITQELAIPTIGIGAGPACDGQILVLADLLGLTDRKSPRFAKRYTELHDQARQAIQTYVEDVRQGVFPGPEQTYDAS